MFKLFGRRPEEVQDIAADINEARESRLRSIAAQESIEQEKPAMNALAATIRARREQNHFGQDFQITMNPRKRHA